MIEGILKQVQETINKRGHPQIDNRLNRHTRVINGYSFSHSYLEGINKMPRIKNKYSEDWVRMYRTYRLACDELKKDKYSRRAVILNTSKYEDVYPCFLSFQILSGENGIHDCVVYQRSSDLSKLEDDITFYEYVMYKVGRRTGLNVSKLIVHFGSIHYETGE